MYVSFIKRLLTPAAIGKRTLPLLLAGVFFAGCTRDLLFVDDLLAPTTGDELLVFKYEAEVTSYREYTAADDGLNLSRTIPDFNRSKFELRMSQTGEVEIFTEHLTPSEDLFQMPDINQVGEVKYEHLVHNRINLYDAKRNLIGEFDASQISSKYQELYVKLINSEKKNINFYNLIDFVDADLLQTAKSNQQRLLNFENEYDNHANYAVYRTTYFDETLGQELVNEVIMHKSSGKVLFISAYKLDGTAIYRSILGYEQDKLVAQAESRLDYSDPANPFKSVTDTKFDNFEFTINKD